MNQRTAPISLLLISYFIFFAMAIPSGILNVAWTYMQGTYSVSLDALGVILFANLVGGLLGTFFSGRIIERFGVGRFLASGALLAALGLLTYGIAPSWALLIGAAFFTSLGISILNAALNLFVSANYTTGQLNWLHACFGLGLTVGPTLATLIVTQWGQSWHLSYLIVLLVMVVVAAITLVTRDRWIMTDERNLGEQATRASLSESLRIPAVLLGMATFFSFAGVVWGTGQLSSTLLTARGIEQAGFWVSLYWGSFTAGRLIMGFIADRIDNDRLIRACMIGGTVGALLLWQTASSPLNLVGLALIGLACAPLYPTLVAATRRRVGLRHRTNAIGFQIACSSLGQTVIPGAFAWIADHTAIGVIAVLPVVGIVLVLVLQEFAVRQRQVAPVSV